MVDSLTTLILSLINAPKTKTLLEVGAHDDKRTKELAKYFKRVSSYYEFLKIPDQTKGNYEIKKLPYLGILPQIKKFDVVLFENEFHHFPDIWQLWTYQKLQPGQTMFLAEWDFTGTANDYYSAFQNCRPLCELTRDLLQKVVKQGLVKIEEKIKGRSEDKIASKRALIAYHQFIFPDHWPFGKEEFLNKIKNLKYPLVLWEGFNLYKIKKA